MADELELVHWAVGFILGYLVYVQYFRAKEEKTNWSVALICGVLGLLFVELVLHGVLG